MMVLHALLRQLGWLVAGPLITLSLLTLKRPGQLYSFGLFDSLDYPGTNIAEGKTVELVSEIKSLKVIPDNTLSWNPQIRCQTESIVFYLDFVSSIFATPKRFA